MAKEDNEAVSKVQISNVGTNPHVFYDADGVKVRVNPRQTVEAEINGATKEALEGTGYLKFGNEGTKEIEEQRKSGAPLPAFAQPAETKAAQPAQVQLKTRKDLNEMTKEELLDYAEQNKFEVAVSLNKSDMVDEIVKQQRAR